MAHLQLVKQTSSGLLLPATPESGDFLRSVKIGEWIHADFKRVRNYAFHKRFFKLLQLGFDYWTPKGGTVTSRNRNLSPDSLIFFATPQARNIPRPLMRRRNSTSIT